MKDIKIPRRFAFSGMKFSGKDYFVNCITEAYTCSVFSFSDPLKAVCADLFPFMRSDYPSNEKEKPIHTSSVSGRQYSPRDIWTMMNVIVEIYPEFLVGRVKAELEEELRFHIDQPDRVPELLIIKDLRPNNPLEYKFCVDNGFSIIYIENLTGEAVEANHVTEQGYDENIRKKCDHYFGNKKDGGAKFMKFFNQIVNKECE